jgi:hypothetical protein
MRGSFSLPTLATLSASIWKEPIQLAVTEPILLNAHSRRGLAQRIVSEMLSLIAGQVPLDQLRRISQPLSTSDTILFVIGS